MINNKTIYNCSIWGKIMSHVFKHHLKCLVNLLNVYNNDNSLNELETKFTCGRSNQKLRYDLKWPYLDLTMILDGSAKSTVVISH